jgi:hypothetical protein
LAYDASLVAECRLCTVRIEERKDIDNELAVARSELERAKLILTNAQGTPHATAAAARWQKAQAQFRIKVGDLNRPINAWNLKVPSPSFHRTRIDVERDIDRIKD